VTCLPCFFSRIGDYSSFLKVIIVAARLSGELVVLDRALPDPGLATFSATGKNKIIKFNLKLFIRKKYNINVIKRDNI
jgi:hypothetical protein